MHNSISSPVPPSREGAVPEDPYHAHTGEGFLPFVGPLTVRSPGAETDEPAPRGSGADECEACGTSDDAYVWVSDRWRVRTTRRPTGLPVVLALESRPHLDLGDLPNLLSAEFGVMTVRLEKAIRSLLGVAQVHLHRWGDGDSHLRLWFLARPAGRLDLRGPYLPVWDRALPPVPEGAWRNHLGAVAVWLADFGGRAVVDPPRLDWQTLPGLSGSEAPTPHDSEAPKSRGGGEMPGQPTRDT